MKKFLKEYSIYIAWGFSLIAMLGSLYYSEVMSLPPCVLCWYLRICLYPLVAILGVGIWQKNKKVYLYAFPLTAVGLVISVYHNLLYYNVLSESLAPCLAGVSCTTRMFNLFGFLPIPTQGLIAVVLINLFLIIYWKLNHND
jgi:disulfide bond formation protein DsbB